MESGSTEAAFYETVAIGPSRYGRQKREAVMFKNGLLLTGVLTLSTATMAAPGSNEASFDPYPAESRELREEGTTHYRIEISPKGELESCEVIRSSGFSRLDLATCALLVRNARFEVKKDEKGRGQRYTHEGQVVWKL